MTAVTIAPDTESLTEGLHALVIGVSSYPFADGPESTEFGKAFGIRNLTSAARSASDVAAWLLKEYRNVDMPLASLNVLFSPSKGETLNPVISDVLRGPARAAKRETVEAEILSFRDLCRQDPGGIAFVYIAGHGVQLNTQGAIVLLEDFGVPRHAELYGSVDVRGCHSGFQDDSLSQRQLWFIDACRQFPEEAKKFEAMQGSFALSTVVGRTEASPLFLSSSSRESAFAEVGGTSLFSQALLWALRGAAVTGPTPSCPYWHVRALDLISVLPARVQELVQEHGELQNVEVTGRVLDLIVQRFSDAPPVDLELCIVPPDYAPPPVATLRRSKSAPVELPPGPLMWPLHIEKVPAGIYSLTLELAHGATDPIFFLAKPPKHSEIVVV